MNIFVVFGTTGQHADRTDWMVKAFSKEDRAKNFTAELNELAIEIRDRNPRYGKKNLANDLDPAMEMDYNGTSYFYEPVELEK